MDLYYSDYELKKALRICVRLESFNHELLDESCKRIIGSLKSIGSEISGPIPLPTKKRIYCVLRSPHVDKDSREHFEIRIHKRILYINVSISVCELLAELDLPAGVFYQISF